MSHQTVRYQTSEVMENPDLAHSVHVHLVSVQSSDPTCPQDAAGVAYQQNPVQDMGQFRQHCQDMMSLGRTWDTPVAACLKPKGQ